MGRRPELIVVRLMDFLNNWMNSGKLSLNWLSLATLMSAKAPSFRHSRKWEAYLTPPMWGKPLAYGGSRYLLKTNNRRHLWSMSLKATPRQWTLHYRWNSVTMNHELLPNPSLMKTKILWLIESSPTKRTVAKSKSRLPCLAKCWYWTVTERKL